MALGVPTTYRSAAYIQPFCILKKDGVYEITTPIPPSTNQRQTIAYKSGRPFITLTRAAREYLAGAEKLRIQSFRYFNNPIIDFTNFEFKFYLARANYDCHNGLKLACDLLERAGIVSNDRFILPQIQKPEIDKSQPRLVIYFQRNLGTTRLCPDQKQKRASPGGMS